jgi:apolipoprotein N-acyltransferase
VIAPQGQTQWKSLPKTQSTHIAHIERRTTQTLYVRYGNWLLPTLILISLGLGLIDRRSLLRQAR